MLIFLMNSYFVCFMFLSLTICWQEKNLALIMKCLAFMHISLFDTQEMEMDEFIAAEEEVSSVAPSS